MRVEVLGGIERRRRWSNDEKLRILGETLAPGAKMAEVSRRNGISASLLFTWRRQARMIETAGPCFAPVRIAAPATSAEKAGLPSGDDIPPERRLPTRRGLIEIDVGSRRRIRVDSDVDADALARVLDVLERR
jgi:transposase